MSWRFFHQSIVAKITRIDCGGRAVARAAESPWLGLVALGTVVLCAQGLFFPSYNSNDDVGIRLMLEGRFVPGSRPSGDVFYINLYLGRMLAAAYRYCPQISWYDLYEQLVLAGAFLVAVRVIQLYVPKPVLLDCLLVIAVSFLAVFVTPQFMAVAMIAVGFGVMAAVLPLFAPRPKAADVSVCGSAVAVTGALLRWDAALLAAMATLVLTTVAMGARVRLGGAARQIATAMVALLVVVALWFGHASFYMRSPDWSRYAQFNLYRAQLTEYAPKDVQAKREALLPRAMPPADWRALNSWIYPQITPAVLDQVKTEATGYWVRKLRPAAIAAQLARCLWLLHFGAPIGLALLGLALMHRDHRRVGRIILGCAICLGLAAIIAVISKPLPWRGVWPLAMIAFATLAATPTAGSKGHPRHMGVVLIWAGAVLTVAITAYWSYQCWRKAGLVRRDLIPLSATNLPVIEIGGAFPLELVERPFRSEVVQRQFGLIPVGAIFPAPVVQRAIAHTPFASLPEDLCGQWRLSVVTTPPILPILSGYLRNHTGQPVSFRLARQGRVLRLYRCDMLDR